MRLPLPEILAKREWKESIGQMELRPMSCVKELYAHGSLRRKPLGTKPMR